MTSGAPEDRVAHGGGDRGHLADLLVGNAQLAQRGGQIFHHCIEVAVVQPPRDQRRMCSRHITSGIIVWTTKDHRQEGLLFCSLALHIDRIKEM